LNEKWFDLIADFGKTLNNSTSIEKASDLIFT